MKNIKKIVLIFVMLIFGLISLTGCDKASNDSKIKIIASNYPGFDFVRAITKNNDKVSINMLLTPGGEIHDFEPTTKDIKAIKNSDMFVYVGGESDEWIEDILNDIDTSKTKVIKLMDLVKTYEEEEVEGMEEDEEEHEHEEEEVEYDEHIWTSPVNAITIVNKLKDEIINIDNSNKKMYENNANSYISKLQKIDNDFKDIVANSKRKEIIFGDRFPLLYFVKEYGLNYYAAFKGCSEATEANPKTIAFLIEKVKEDKVPVVFHIELSNGKIAKEIEKETGAKVLEFNTAHNISKKDFDAGKTYIDIMNDNIKVLKEALN